MIGLVSTLAACSPAPRETAPAPPPVSAAAPSGDDGAAFPEAPEVTDACADRSRILVDLTEHDSGRAVSLHPGDELCVRLPSNRALNYAWGFNDSLVGTVDLVGEPGYVLGAGSAAGGTESWRLRAVKAGETTLHFEYLHASDEPLPPEKQVSFSVLVR